MKTRKCKVLVVGAGPGGYVAAIRSTQLGMDTVIVEVKELAVHVGRGCIPSKAMIHAPQIPRFSKARKEGGHMGISIPGPAELVAALKGWKDDIVDRLNKGVEHLLKAAGAELITGWAEFKDAKTVVVGDTQIEAEFVILANGSVPIELPFMKYGDGIISSREALDIGEIRTPSRGWWRIHRSGTRNYTQNAWYRSNNC